MRVVIAEDVALLREGLARLLESEGVEVVGQSANADDLMRHVALRSPDVAIVDIRLPPTHTDEGLAAAKRIRADHPSCGVLVLSQHLESEYAMDLLSDDATGVGYLLKERVANVADLTDALRRIHEGGTVIDQTIVAELVGRRRKNDPLESLTRVEREVLELMAQGRTNQAIADQRVVTLRAVEKHVTAIFEKLGLPAGTDDHRRVLAVLAYLRAGS